MHITSDDARLFYEVEGSGPPLVLLHPFPTNHNFWRPLVGALAQRYRVIAPDLRAHGTSEPGAGPATMQKHAADLARICDAAQVSRAAFCGVSIGGYLLFEFWRQFRERVRALVLCDTRAQADTAESRNSRLQIAEQVEKEGPAAYLDSMVPKLLGATTVRNRPDIVTAAREMMAAMSVAGIAAALRGMAARPDSVETAKTINVPCMVMVGEEDTLTPPADAELMQRAIAGSELARVPAAGHYSPLEQPEFVLKKLRAFLERLPAE